MLFAFLSLVVLNRFFVENPKFYSKIIIHLFLALILVDVIWLIVIMPYWNSKSNTKNPYWESLSGIHTFALILAFFEMFLKAGISAVLFYEFKLTYPNDVNELFKIGYTLPQSLISNNKKFMLKFFRIRN